MKSVLDAILKNERTLKMLDGFREGKAVEELCQKCSYKDRFNEKLIRMDNTSSGTYLLELFYFVYSCISSYTVSLTRVHLIGENFVPSIEIATHENL